MVVIDECIRRVTLPAGAALTAWSESSLAVVGALPAAAGDAEFETDATQVNTTGGWRDAKIGLFVRRPRGAPAAAAAWAERVLPALTARLAFAGIAERRVFAARWGRTAERLGLARDGAGLTVLGDGAEWIWNRAAEQFPAATGVLDVFHAAEHVTAAQRRFGQGTAAWAQAERGRAQLLSDGYARPARLGGRVGRPVRGGQWGRAGGVAE